MSSAGSPYWIGEPGPNGYCKVTYHPATSGTDEFVSFEWSGGNGSSSGDTSGGTSGGDSGTGGGSGDSGGNTPPGTRDDEAPIDSNTWNSIVNKYGLVEWPTASTGEHYSWKKGQIVRFKGVYYISLEDGEKLFNQWGYCNPESEDKKSSFAVVSNRFYTSKDVDIQGNLAGLSRGDIFIDDVNGKAYVCKIDIDSLSRPSSGGSDQWVLIDK